MGITWPLPVHFISVEISVTWHCTSGQFKSCVTASQGNHIVNHTIFMSYWHCSWMCHKNVTQYQSWVLLWYWKWHTHILNGMVLPTAVSTHSHLTKVMSMTVLILRSSHALCISARWQLTSSETFYTSLSVNLRPMMKDNVFITQIDQGI